MPSVRAPRAVPPSVSVAGSSAVGSLAVGSLAAEVSRGARSLRHERIVPVSPALVPLLPEGGLVRGRCVACTGPAAASLALAVVAPAVTAGTWLAAVSMPWLGAEAAGELGVDLARLIRVDVPAAERWAEVVVAAVEGFEVVLAAPPRSLRGGPWRRVEAQVKARGAVVVLVDLPPSVRPDVVLRSGRAEWEWAGRHRGHLAARRIRVHASGRRIPRERTADLWLPAPDPLAERPTG